MQLWDNLLNKKLFLLNFVKSLIIRKTWHFLGPSVNVQVTLFVGAFGLFDTQESVSSVL